MAYQGLQGLREKTTTEQHGERHDRPWRLREVRRKLEERNLGDIFFQPRKYSFETGILAGGTFLARSRCYWQGIHISEPPHAIRFFSFSTFPSATFHDGNDT